MYIIKNPLVDLKLDYVLHSNSGLSGCNRNRTNQSTGRKKNWRNINKVSVIQG